MRWVSRHWATGFGSDSRVGGHHERQTEGIQERKEDEGREKKKRLKGKEVQMTDDADMKSN